jgi:hypothetical protein
MKKVLFALLFCSFAVSAMSQSYGRYRPCRRYEEPPRRQYRIIQSFQQQSFRQAWRQPVRVVYPQSYVVNGWYGTNHYVPIQQFQYVQFRRPSLLGQIALGLLQPNPFNGIGWNQWQGGYQSSICAPVRMPMGLHDF